ncbi:MAG: YihY/virulence factor BrkB family protein [Acidimicrobiia bacterium]|nr:YihY/virulence factor BrkB family protein [Acidimicrobiia bacterium]NNF87897.1 YihY/virulence factor BrkB family protein [Acidimicrobiia bacterium]NNJ46404.1 YihY/virulence factor BrkB family protein [Acidimicrobiia bacterium]NNL14672.1 YihY/virulence factor BrkB family protein [Acidimicrobiia bacterium]RZV44886.1 MAG: YihY/virulence factor BrkB family protein [Acidimicrobiia bacterium]
MDDHPQPGDSLLDRVRTWPGEAYALAKDTIKDTFDDRLPGLAAEVAFYLVLSLPSLLLVVLGLLGYVGEIAGAGTVADIKDQLLEWANSIFSQSTITDTVEPAIDSLLEQGRADVLTIGGIIALWSGSRAARVIVDAVTIAYDLEDHRDFRRKTLVGLWLTVAGILSMTVLIPLLVVGPRFGAALAENFGLESAFETVWAVLYWPVVATVGVVLLTWVLHIAPPHSTPWRRDVAGAILALVVWALGSLGLRIYTTSFLESNSAFSLFTAPIAVLLWLYVSAIAVLLGAELNAEIEKRWPHSS